MSITDLLTAVRVSAPRLSPDGALVAYVRTSTDPSSLKRNSDIWVVPADGSGAPKLLVGGEKTENTPRWAPDGRHIAFISTRDGAPQVYVADADGSHIRQHPDELPVVKLQQDSYEHTDRSIGRVKYPELPVMRWVKAEKYLAAVAAVAGRPLKLLERV